MKQDKAMSSHEDFYAPRRCMREPIQEIFDAAGLLNQATDAHLAGDRPGAEALIRAAEIPAIRSWIESLIGSRAANPDQRMYHRFRKVPAPPPKLRIAERMPTSAEKKIVIERYGRNCVFCGIPLISDKVRRAFHREYPDAMPWGRTNLSRHAAFQCMWMQFDHVVPHSHGGDNSLENVVVTCGPCNFGRMQWTLEEVGLLDPRERPIQKAEWDGLERMLLMSY